METNNQVALKQEQIIVALQSAPEILSKNELSVSKCNAAGQLLLDRIASTGGRITSDDTDASVREYLEKVKQTLEGAKPKTGGEKTGGMYNRRKPVTQLLQEICKRFTSLENEINPKTAESIPWKLQNLRDKYASEKLAEQRRQEEEARRKKLAEDEKISYRADLGKLLDDAYAHYASSIRKSMTEAFDGVTVENYQTRLTFFNDYKVAFSWGEYTKHINGPVATSYLDDNTINAIKREVAHEKKQQYGKLYVKEFTELLASIVERMPSKRKALIEEAELRRNDAEAASLAEAERKKREAEDAARAEAERKREEEARRAKAEADRQAAEAMAALNFMNAVTPNTPPAKAKITKKIRVLNPKGFIELYQFWFVKEGADLSMTELEKIHKKMITFCEKEANKDGELIKSSFIQYEDDVKAK